MSLNYLSPTEIVFDGIVLKLTCGACPEQYDAFDARGNQIGYLRLRHGYFSVSCPGVMDETVYEGSPRGDGLFDDDEREYFLTEAVAAIKRWKEEQ